MTEPLRFPVKEKRVVTVNPEPAPIEPGVQRMPFYWVEIPAANALFDENRTTYLGEPVSAYRARMAASCDEEQFRTVMGTLEQSLADSRAQFIFDRFRGEEEKLACIELGKITYAAALHVQSDELRELGRDLLRAKLGEVMAVRAMKLIQDKVETVKNVGK